MSLWSSPVAAAVGVGVWRVGSLRPPATPLGWVVNVTATGKREKLGYSRDVPEHLRCIAVGFESRIYSMSWGTI